MVDGQAVVMVFVQVYKSHHHLYTDCMPIL